MIKASSTVSDFPDWLSPILIKELRQGMRARVFGITFITVQALMITTVGIGLMMASYGETAQMTGVFFWLMIGLPVLIVLPFSGFKSINGEVTGHTLELIQLTHLNAWRIMWGKWLAIVAQVLLLMCAVLPYAVLRYFMGRVNIAGDLQGLGAMLLASVTLTAVMVGLSSLENRLARALIMVGFFFGLQILSPLVIGLTASGGMVSLPSGFSLLAFTVFSCAVIIVLMLKIGAGRIAPLSENHTTGKRLLGVFIWATALLASLFLSNFQGVGFYAFLGCIPIFIGALIEEEPQYQNIYRPFVRRGIFGRFLGRFLYPGWPAGIVYLGTMLLGFLFSLLVVTKFDHLLYSSALFVGVLGCFLVPALFLRILPLRGDNAAVVFFVFQAVGFALGMLALGMADFIKFPMTELAALHPLGAVIGLLKLGSSASPSEIWIFVPALFLTTGVTVIGLAIYLLAAWRRMSHREKQSILAQDELA